MPYIDTKYLGQCETCRHHRSGQCDTWCDCGECYQPDMTKIPTADVVEVVRCSECAYCAENICPITGHKMYFCAYHPNNYPVTLTHYCGHGKRKAE